MQLNLRITLNAFVTGWQVELKGVGPLPLADFSHPSPGIFAYSKDIGAVDNPCPIRFMIRGQGGAPMTPKGKCEAMFGVIDPNNPNPYCARDLPVDIPAGSNGTYAQCSFSTDGTWPPKIAPINTAQIPPIPGPL